MPSDSIPLNELCLLIEGRDLPLCIVRPLYQLARQTTPNIPEYLVRNVLASLSLNITDKNRILTSDQLSEFQMVELDAVFDDERDTFKELFADETETVMALQAKALMTSFLLASFHGNTVPPAMERALIARLVKRVARRVAKLELSHKLGFWVGNVSTTTTVVWHHLYPSDHPAAILARQDDLGCLTNAII